MEWVYSGDRKPDPKLVEIKCVEACLTLDGATFTLNYINLEPKKKTPGRPKIRMGYVDDAKKEIPAGNFYWRTGFNDPIPLNFAVIYYKKTHLPREILDQVSNSFFDWIMVVPNNHPLAYQADSPFMDVTIDRGSYHWLRIRSRENYPVWTAA